MSFERLEKTAKCATLLCFSHFTCAEWHLQVCSRSRWLSAGQFRCCSQEVAVDYLSAHNSSEDVTNLGADFRGMLTRRLFTEDANTTQSVRLQRTAPGNPYNEKQILLVQTLKCTFEDNSE
jgi:hypothetical protein